MQGGFLQQNRPFLGIIHHWNVQSNHRLWLGHSCPPFPDCQQVPQTAVICLSTAARNHYVLSLCLSDNRTAPIFFSELNEIVNMLRYTHLHPEQMMRAQLCKKNTTGEGGCGGLKGALLKGCTLLQYLPPPSSGNVTIKSFSLWPIWHSPVVMKFSAKPSQIACNATKLRHQDRPQHVLMVHLHALHLSLLLPTPSNDNAAFAALLSCRRCFICLVCTRVYFVYHVHQSKVPVQLSNQCTSQCASRPNFWMHSLGEVLQCSTLSRPNVSK